MFKLVDTIGKSLVNMTGKTGLRIKSVSPEIFLILGIGGGIGATVLACKATLKVDGVKERHNEKIDKIHEYWGKVQEGEIPLDEYSDLDHKKDLAVTYTQTAADFISLYGPAIVLGTVSIGFIIGGHYALKRTNMALIAAYKVVDEGFTAYRKRVIKEHGAEADYMYKNGLVAEDVLVPAYTDEAGAKHKAQTVKKMVVDPNGLSMYARFYDESCKQWSPNPEYNLMFLRAQQNYYNDMLKARGHVFLNEVYDALGIERTQAGAVVGWVIGENRDNFIDFGIFDKDRDSSRNFVNGYEKNIMLDFNVDGVIFDVFTK